MKILLIGSSGMMGTAIEEVCNREKIDCIGLTHDDLDITNFTAIKEAIEKNKPDTVINMAVIQGVDPCELEPQRAFDVNAIAVSNLAKICQKHGITLVQGSTHAVFDGTKDDYYTEDDLPNPTSIYSASKYVAECFAKNLCTKHYITRFPTLFGASRYIYKGFVEKMLERIERGEEVRVADDKIDSPTYTMDAAETLISLLEKEKPSGIYHVANSGMVSYYDFIAKLIEILKVDVSLVRAKDKDFKSIGYKPLKSALRSIKLEPLRGWEDALYEYITKEARLQGSQEKKDK